MAQTKVKLISDGVIDVGHLASGHGITTDNIGEGSNLYYTDARVSTYLSTNSYATENWVNTNYLTLSGGSITGTLGIGTASILSGNKLDVRGGNIMVGGYGTGVDYGLIFTPADSSSYWHIYNDTSGALAFGRHATIGNSEHLRIDSSGRVGIGTSSPASTFHAEGTGTYVATINNTAQDARIELQKSGTQKGQISAGDSSLNLYGVDNLRFLSGGSASEAMRINSTGNIGIGTTSLSIFSEKLTVNGDILLSDGSFGTGDKFTVMLGDANAFMQSEHGQKVLFGAYNGFRFSRATSNNKTVSTDWMTITDSGNVGIATSSPSEKLHVVGRGRFESAIGAGDNVRTGLGHWDTTSQTAGVGGQIVLGYRYTDSGSYTEGAILKMYKENSASGHYGSGLKFQVRNTGYDLSTKMVLNPSGFLGIGEQDPTARLHVVANGFPQVRINDDFSGGESGIRFRSYTDTSNDLHGDIFVQHTSGNETGRMGFRVPYTQERMTILSDGNIGIGTTSPVNILDVNGTIRSIGGISTDNSAKSYTWTLHNTLNSGTVWRRIARFTASQSDRIKITLTGQPGYSNGASFGATATIIAQYNNANNLQGTFSREGSTQPIYGVNFEQISGTDYYINVQVGSYSEFAIEAVISGGTLTTINASSTAGISANVAEEKRIYSPTYFSDSNVGINGVREHRESFTATGTTALNFDIDVKNVSASGQPFEVFAGWTHYSTTYGCMYKAAYYQRSTVQSDITLVATLINQSSTNAGAWSVSWIDADTIRISKSAGTHGSNGYGYIRVTQYQP